MRGGLSHGLTRAREPPARVSGCIGNSVLFYSVFVTHTDAAIATRIYVTSESYISSRAFFVVKGMKCAIVHSWQPGGLHDGGDIFCDNLTNFSVIIEVYESDSMTEACGSVTTVRTVKLWQTKELGMCRDFKLSGLSMRNRTSVSSQFALVWHPKASLPVLLFL